MRWKTRGGLSALSVLIIICLMTATVARAQVKSEIELQLDDGKRKYEIFDFEGAIAAMTAIIEGLDGKLSAGSELNEIESRVYPQALAFRALSHLDMANEEAGKRDFEKLIRFSPGFTLPGDLASQLYLDLFSTLKEEMVGFLQVSTDPAEIEIELDGKASGLSGGEPFALLVGEHRVSVARRGYAPEERQVTIQPEATAELSIELRRTLATVYLRTSPPGAEVLLDGEVVGVTSGTAGSDYADKLSELNLRADEVSAEFAIEFVEIGTHQLTVRKECFASEQRFLEVPTADDFWLDELLAMPPSRGSLRLNGLPEGAEVLLDDEVQERGKDVFEDLCSGEYVIEVRHAGGMYKADAVVSKDLETEMEVLLLPTLAYAGAVFRGQLEDDQRQAATRELDRLFGSVERFRIIGRDDESMQGLLREGTLTPEAFERLVAEGAVEGRIPDDIYRGIRDASRRLGTNLLAVAVFQEKTLGTKFRLFIAGTQGPYTDSFVVVTDDPASVERAVRRLDYQFDIEQSWLGISAVDTLMHEGPVVISVQEGSPAADAGVEVAEAITAVDGNAISGYRDLIESLRDKMPGESFALEFRKGGETNSREIVLGKSPLLLPLFSLSFSYNAAIAEMSLIAELNPGTEKEQLALLNTGLALAHFGAWEDAIVYLRRVNLGDRPGINQGTVEYYLGICYESLGYRAEALNHYRSSLGYASATLVSNDGPLVAPHARQKVSQFEPSP